MVALDLASNQLSGTLPATIGSLTNVQFLNLNSNQLSGYVPMTIGNLKTLYQLDISYNNFVCFQSGLQISPNLFCNLNFNPWCPCNWNVLSWSSKTCFKPLDCLPPAPAPVLDNSSTRASLHLFSQVGLLLLLVILSRT